jgi:hypothetical protein
LAFTNTIELQKAGVLNKPALCLTTPIVKKLNQSKQQDAAKTTKNSHSHFSSQSAAKKPRL